MLDPGSPQAAAYRRLAEQVLRSLPAESLLELHQAGARAAPEQSAEQQPAEQQPSSDPVPGSNLDQGPDGLPPPPLRMGKGPDKSSWLESAASKLGLR